MKEKENQTLFRGDESDNRETNEKKMEEFIIEKLGQLLVNRGLQKIDKNGLL